MSDDDADADTDPVLAAIEEGDVHDVLLGHMNEGETAEEALDRLLRAAPSWTSHHCVQCGRDLEPLDESDWVAERLRVEDTDLRRTDLYCGVSCLVKSMNARLEVPITEAPGVIVMADDTLLRQPGVRRRMRCSGQVASRIEDTFVTVEQLVDAVESHDDLTEIDGIGPATAEVIEDWWANRFEREANMDASTFERTGAKTATIHLHTSWEDALGEADQNTSMEGSQ